MEENRNLEGHTVWGMGLLEHGSAHYQGLGGREVSWLSQPLGSGFCKPPGTCKVTKLGRWEDPRDLVQLNRKECRLKE